MFQLTVIWTDLGYRDTYGTLIFCLEVDKVNKLVAFACSLIKDPHLKKGTRSLTSLVMATEPGLTNNFTFFILQVLRFIIKEPLFPSYLEINIYYLFFTSVQTQ